MCLATEQYQPPCFKSAPHTINGVARERGDRNRVGEPLTMKGRPRPQHGRCVPKRRGRGHVLPERSHGLFVASSKASRAKRIGNASPVGDDLTGAHQARGRRRKTTTDPQRATTEAQCQLCVQVGIKHCGISSNWAFRSCIAPMGRMRRLASRPPGVFMKTKIMILFFFFCHDEMFARGVVQSECSKRTGMKHEKGGWNQSVPP